MLGKGSTVRNLTTTLTILMCVLCSCMACPSEKDVQHFELKQILGRWNVIADTHVKGKPAGQCGRFNITSLPANHIQIIATSVNPKTHQNVTLRGDIGIADMTGTWKMDEINGQTSGLEKGGTTRRPRTTIRKRTTTTREPTTTTMKPTPPKAMGPFVHRILEVDESELVMVVCDSSKKFIPSGQRAVILSRNMTVEPKKMSAIEKKLSAHIDMKDLLS